MQGIQPIQRIFLLQPCDRLDVWSLPVGANARTSTVSCQTNNPLDVAPTAAWGVAHTTIRLRTERPIPLIATERFWWLHRTPIDLVAERPNSFISNKTIPLIAQKMICLVTERQICSHANRTIPIVVHRTSCLVAERPCCVLVRVSSKSTNQMLCNGLRNVMFQQQCKK